MVSRDRAEELAERLTDLQAEIRAEIEAASSDLRAVGVLTYLKEAAALLEQAGLRMGWWLIPAGPEATKPGSGPETVLAGEDLHAAARYVATQAPELAPALTWAIGVSPALVAALDARPPASGELAFLAELDETLAAIVAASPAGFRRSGQVWQKPEPPADSDEPVVEAAAGPLTVTFASVARTVRKVARSRPDLVPACLWLIQSRPATRLAVAAFPAKPEELAELSEMACEDREAPEQLADAVEELLAGAEDLGAAIRHVAIQAPEWSSALALAVGRVCGAEGGRHHGGLLGKLSIEARHTGSYLRAVSLEESRRPLAEPANDKLANDDDRGQREKA